MIIFSKINKVFLTPIKDLNLSARAQNWCARNGIETLIQLVWVNTNSRLPVNHFNYTSNRVKVEIEKLVVSKNLKFRMTDEEIMAFK